MNVFEKSLIVYARKPDRAVNMPKGPRGEKRPADVIGAAVKVMKIATGEIKEETDARPPKNAAAAELGRLGGKARADKLTPEQRAETARLASLARWRKKGR